MLPASQVEFLDVSSTSTGSRISRRRDRPARSARHVTRAIAGIIVAAAAIEAAAASAGAEGRSPSSSPVQVLEEMTVTGSRMRSAIADIPAAVSAIDLDEIRQQFGLSTDVLKAIDVRVPGLNVASGGRSQCLTNVRGRVPSFQINGVPANQDLRPSNCNSAFQVSPFAIERVEVVRGATALFGAGAPGGIVNIQTRRADSSAPEVDIVLQSGFSAEEPDGTFANDLYAGVGQALDGYDYYIGLGWQDYDGARDPNGDLIPATAFQSWSVNAALGVQVSPDVELRFTGTWYEEDPGREYNVSGADVDAGVDFPSVIEVLNNPFRNDGVDRNLTLATSISVKDVLGHRLEASIFYQQQEFHQRANFQDFNAGAPDFFSDDRENSTFGTRATLARAFEFGDRVLEVEYGADLQRNRLLRVLLDPEAPTTVTGLISPEVTLDTTGLFVQIDFSWQALRLTGGARQEYYRGEIGDRYARIGLSGQGAPGDFDDAELTLWNAGAVYDISDAFQLYASFNQGAELTQLGRAARRALDPSLISPEPARSDQYEVGGRGRIGEFEVTFAGFRSKSDAASLVQPDPACAGESFCPLIPLRVPQKVWGAEATLSWAASDTLDVGAVFTWQEGEIFNEQRGEFIPFGADRVSPTRGTTYVDWQPDARMTLSAQATYIAATNFFSPSQRDFGLVDTDSVFIADASFRVKLDSGSLNIGISNLLNESYENVTLAAGGFTPTLAEGRRVTIGYSASF